MGFFVPADTQQGSATPYTPPPPDHPEYIYNLPATYTPPPSRTPPPPATPPPPSGGLPATYTPPPRNTTTGGFTATGRNPTPDEVMAHLRDIYTPAGALPHSQANPTVPPLKGDVPFGTTPPPAAKTTTTTPATTTSTDYSHRLPGESTQDWVVRWAKGNNRPDIAADPSYWVSAINSKPPSDDMGYWVGRLNTPDTGGSGDSAGGFGAFTAPYTGTYVPPVTNFQAPVGTDDPGFKFAVEQGQDAIARSAAAKGNLLTGGTLKDLASYTTGAALQDYAGSYNRALNTAGFNNNTAFQAFGQNYDIFRNNQNDPFQKLYATTGLGLNAAGNANSALGNYSGNLSDLTNNFASQYVNATFGQGNANAAGTQISSAQRNQFYQGLSDYLKNYHF